MIASHEEGALEYAAILGRSVERERPHRGLNAIAEQPYRSLRLRMAEHEESNMISEIKIHTIARQMFEKHGTAAIAQAAQNALASERKGDAEEAKEWRHIEDAMKMMRGPHQS